MQKHVYSLAILLLLIVLQCHGRVQELSFDVKGMVCAFCATGIENALKRIKDVEQVHVNLKDGIVTVTTKNTTRLSINDLKIKIAKAIKGTPFTLGEIRSLVAQGSKNKEPQKN